MSSNQSGEGEIRRGIVEVDLVDCMVALPGQLFYSTQIPVCLWLVAKNKGNGRFRDRRTETLFIDARKLGTIERGRVTSIEGGRAAAMLRDLVDRADDGARVLAELGIGLNPTIAPRGHVMLDEKAAGTAHVAIGNNIGSYGGANSSTIHVDCILATPTVEVDGRRLELPT